MFLENHPSSFENRSIPEMIIEVNDFKKCETNVTLPFLSGYVQDILMKYKYIASKIIDRGLTESPIKTIIKIEGLL